MKISQFSTECALDKLCEIVPYADSIMGDEELVKVCKEKINPTDEKMTAAAWVLLGVRKASKLIPVLLKRHRDDVCAIIAALNDTTAGEIKKQNIIVTMAQMREIIKDEDLAAFFTSCATKAENE